MQCQQCGVSVSNDEIICHACGAKIIHQSVNDPLIGRTFLNQYIIRKKLGQGGYGSVYEADQPSISRKAALKVLHPHLASQPEIAIRFRREGLAASRLQHPSIVGIYNFGETEDGIIWIAMEHIDGETLSTRLRRKGALSSRELIDVLGPICEALQEAHQKGIIHRDIKPDNIMLTRGPNGEMLPKLLDFGVAALVDDVQATQSGTMSGSPPYMPPEQWKGLKFTDARTDIYALGVVAYQCLTNRLPFDADTAPSWMQKHCTEQPLDIARYSKGLPLATQSVILKSLLKEPEQRFQTTLEFKKALEDAERGIAAELPLASATAQLPAPVFKTKPEQSNRKIIFVGVLSAVAAIAFVFTLQFLLNKPAEQSRPPTKTISEGAEKIVTVQNPVVLPTPTTMILNIPKEDGSPRSQPSPPPEVKKIPVKKTSTPITPGTPKALTAKEIEKLEETARAEIQKQLVDMAEGACPQFKEAGTVIIFIDGLGAVTMADGNMNDRGRCLAKMFSKMKFPAYATGTTFSLSIAVLPPFP